MLSPSRLARKCVAEIESLFEEAYMALTARAAAYAVEQLKTGGF